MIQQTERIQARCKECGKAYLVPDAGRVYRCKVCRGPVQALGLDEDDLTRRGLD